MNCVTCLPCSNHAFGHCLRSNAVQRYEKYRYKQTPELTFWAVGV